ncbi:hypothetical protein Dimus_004189 [Dionaea muscipula]
MMVLSTAVPVSVKASAATTTARLRVSASSWDTTGERLPYNRNAPRKHKKPDALSLSFSPSSSSTPTATNSTPPKEIDVHRLLSFPKQDKVHLEETTYLGYERWMPSPPKVEKPQSAFNAAILAYIGDCIYELYARRHFLSPALKIDEYNDRVMAVVCCETQDAFLQKLLKLKFLSGEERNVLRWGKNINSAKTKTKKRAGAAVYNRASSLETLVGYLYLTNVKRLEDLMSQLGFSVGVSNQSILDELDRGLPNIKQKK